MPFDLHDNPFFVCVCVSPRGATDVWSYPDNPWCCTVCFIKARKTRLSECLNPTFSLTGSPQQFPVSVSTISHALLNPKRQCRVWQSGLPGAGNLLRQAGEDLSGLPDRARRYKFFYWQYHISIQVLDFESLWQFLFCGSAIATLVSFYIIKPTGFSVIACDWLASIVKPVRS